MIDRDWLTAHFADATCTKWAITCELDCSPLRRHSAAAAGRGRRRRPDGRDARRLTADLHAAVGAGDERRAAGHQGRLR